MRSLKHIMLIAAALLLPLAAGADTRQLFNGKDLSGWRHIGFGRFVVEDGLLHPVGGIGLLWFEGEKIHDAVLRVVYRVGSNKDNSGVFVRIPSPPEDPWMPVNKALEVQINNAGETELLRTGSIYTFAGAQSQPGAEGRWTTMDITLDGPRTRVHINGQLVSEYAEGDPVPPKHHDGDPDRGPRPDSGYIGVQNHPFGEAVYFREISVRPIEP
jgi:hypothetical protein